MSRRTSPRPGSSRWTLIVVAIAAFIAALAIIRGRSRSIDVESPVEVGSLPPEDVEVGDELEAVRLDPRPSDLAAAPSTEPPPFYGFCPTDVEPFERPSPAALVNERLDELADRARRALGRRQGSAALRRGLSRLYATASSGDDEGEAVATIATLRGAPDRATDGFDHAAAAAMVVSVRAIRSEDLRRAMRWSKIAARDAPEDPAPLMLQFIIAQREHDVIAARHALKRAFELAPTEPGIALAVGQSFSRTAELGLALGGLDAYLRAFPEDAETGGLRARVEIRLDLVSEFRRGSRAGVTALWSPEVGDDLGERALETVLEDLDGAAALLGVERRQELTLFIYGARADLLAATCVQSWAKAAFDGALHLDGEGLARPSIMEKHIAHESLHAQLAAVAPNAPIWLHEGLAQHIARQRSDGHDRSYRFMIDQRTWVPFASLGGSFQVISDSDDAQLAYHQSLAMVQLLAERRGEAVFHEAVVFLGGGGDPEMLFEHLAGPRSITGSDLLEFLEARLDRGL